jgi:hypothetical protein
VPTPAPSPPPSPAPKKKQQFQTDQTRPFVLPFSLANASRNGVKNTVPRAIQEAGELYKRSMRISTEVWQTWKLREEYIEDETGVGRAAMEKERWFPEEAVEEDEEQMDSLKMLVRLEEKWNEQLKSLGNEKERKVLREKIGDVKRLQRVELLYVSGCLNHQRTRWLTSHPITANSLAKLAERCHRAVETLTCHRHSKQQSSGHDEFGRR